MLQLWLVVGEGQVRWREERVRDRQQGGAISMKASTKEEGATTWHHVGSVTSGYIHLTIPGELYGS